MAKSRSRPWPNRNTVVRPKQGSSCNKYWWTGAVLKIRMVKNSFSLLSDRQIVGWRLPLAKVFKHKVHILFPGWTINNWRTHSIKTLRSTNVCVTYRAECVCLLLSDYIWWVINVEIKKNTNFFLSLYPCMFFSVLLICLCVCVCLFCLVIRLYWAMCPSIIQHSSATGPKNTLPPCTFRASPSRTLTP